MSKKVRVNKAIFGRKVFNNRVELEYYRKYQEINLAKELVVDIHQAVGIADGYIASDSAEEELRAWQMLIDTGVCWKLRSWFGRQAHWLIDNNICKAKVVN